MTKRKKYKRGVRAVAGVGGYQSRLREYAEERLETALNEIGEASVAADRSEADVCDLRDFASKMLARTEGDEINLHSAEREALLRVLTRYKSAALVLDWLYYVGSLREEPRALWEELYGSVDEREQATSYAIDSMVGKLRVIEYIDRGVRLASKHGIDVASAVRLGSL